MAEFIKSPFLVIQDILDHSSCIKIAQSVRVQAIKDNEGVFQPVQRHHDSCGLKVTEAIKPYISYIERYFDFKYKGIDEMIFQQYPPTNGALAEEPHCENAVYKRKRWMRIKDCDLTGLIWLKNYNDAPPFNMREHVYGGKLEFPSYQFGFQPQAGTMVIYPASENFISLTSPIQVGELQAVRFNIYSVDKWEYDKTKYPGDFRTWFMHVV
jgi:hypothetical protein